LGHPGWHQQLYRAFQIFNAAGTLMLKYAVMVDGMFRQQYKLQIAGAEAITISGAATTGTAIPTFSAETSRDLIEWWCGVLASGQIWSGQYYIPMWAA